MHWHTLEAKTAPRPRSLHSPFLAPGTHRPRSLHSHPCRLGGRIHTHTLRAGDVERNVDLGATFVCGVYTSSQHN